MRSIKELINTPYAEYTPDESQYTRKYSRFSKQLFIETIEWMHRDTDELIDGYDSAIAEGDVERAKNLLNFIVDGQRDYDRNMIMAQDTTVCVDESMCDGDGMYIDFELMLEHINDGHLHSITTIGDIVSLAETVEDIQRLHNDVRKLRAYIVSNKKLIQKFNNAIQQRANKRKRITNKNNNKLRLVG